MQTRDEVEGLHNCREFSQPLECLYQAMQTQEKSFLLLFSAVARPNGQPRQAGVARGGRGHAPPPREILNFSLSEMRFAAFSGPFGNFFAS